MPLYRFTTKTQEGHDITSDTTIDSGVQRYLPDTELAANADLEIPADSELEVLP